MGELVVLIKTKSWSGLLLETESAASTVRHGSPRNRHEQSTTRTEASVSGAVPTRFPLSAIPLGYTEMLDDRCGDTTDGRLSSFFGGPKGERQSRSMMLARTETAGLLS